MAVGGGLFGSGKGTRPEDKASDILKEREEVLGAVPDGDSGIGVLCFVQLCADVRCSARIQGFFDAERNHAQSLSGPVVQVLQAVL